MLTKNNFACKKCGECCRAYTVVLNENDISKITGLGYSQEFFAEMDYDPEKKDARFVLKRENGSCIFLKSSDNKSICAIYENRPLICAIYPFFQDEIKSCKPHELIKRPYLSKGF
jgi:Fe-S-cluster containining protein